MLCFLSYRILRRFLWLSQCSIFCCFCLDWTLRALAIELLHWNVYVFDGAGGLLQLFAFVYGFKKRSFIVIPLPISLPHYTEQTKIITIKLQSPSFGWLRRTKTQSSKTEWRRQRWLGYEYWTRLAKRLYRQGCGCLNIGRWHTNESSWPCTKLCKYIKLDIRVFTLCFFCIRYTQHIYWMYFKKCEKKWTKWSLWANFRVTYLGY